MGIPVGKHVENVRLYVQAHLSEKITVSEIARARGLNASYLNTCFREQTGENVSAYVRRMKILRAQALLDGTARRVPRTDAPRYKGIEESI